MKEDLSRLMDERNLDAIVVSGKVHGNPPLTYLTKGAGLTQALIIQKRGAGPQAIINPMEREEAAVLGYPLTISSRYKYHELLREHEGDALRATVAYYARIFEDLDVQGRVGFYGLADQGQAYALLTALEAGLPDIQVTAEFQDDLISAARTTKDAAEVARIREMGRRTAEIVRQTEAFLREHAVDDDEQLLRADGEILTVGDVHAHIRRMIALQGLEDPEGFIFATGRDSGIPHSKGTLEKPMRLGESIVFDIFPCEAGGGYFFDMTRTFCLGYAPEAMQRLYDDVLASTRQVIANLAVGTPTRHYQQMTCAFFRERGHPTIAEDASALSGYIHSLGHGVGLELHETPMFRDTPDNTAQIAPGHVFTVEPGLYYPDEGMGCRIEDIIYVDPEGNFENLTAYPYQLIIPMA